MGQTVGERWWKNVVLSVFSVAVMAKCFEACVPGEYYFRSCCSTPVGTGDYDASISVKRKSMGHTVGGQLWKNMFFCVLSVAVTEKCFEAFGYGDYCFRSGNSASEVAVVCHASISVERMSMGHTVVERWKKIVINSVFSVAAMEKCFEACC
jgi:hypothetical protein